MIVVRVCTGASVSVSVDDVVRFEKKKYLHITRDVIYVISRYSYFIEFF